MTHAVQTHVVRGSTVVIYKGNPLNLPAEFSEETLQVRREWQDMFKVPTGKNLQPILHCLQGYCSELKERESFPDKQKLKEFITSRSALQEMFKGVFKQKKKMAVTESKEIYERNSFIG